MSVCVHGLNQNAKGIDYCDPITRRRGATKAIHPRTANISQSRRSAAISNLSILADVKGDIVVGHETAEEDEPFQVDGGGSIEVDSPLGVVRTGGQRFHGFLQLLTEELERGAIQDDASAGTRSFGQLAEVVVERLRRLLENARQLQHGHIFFAKGKRQNNYI